jgi:hypothetical protein
MALANPAITLRVIIVVILRSISVRRARPVWARS